MRGRDGQSQLSRRIGRAESICLCEARLQREWGALVKARCRVIASRVTEAGGDVGGNGNSKQGGQQLRWRRSEGGSDDDCGERKSEVGRRRWRTEEGELRENLRGSDGIGPDTWPVRSGRAPRRLRVALLLRPSFSPPPPLALSAVAALALAAAPAPVAVSVASLALVAVAAAAAFVIAADIAAAFALARGNGALPRLDQRVLPAPSLRQACRLDAPHTLGNTNRHAKLRSTRAYRLRGYVRRYGAFLSRRMRALLNIDHSPLTSILLTTKSLHLPSMCVT
ncbi:hypothetical protein K523DRAFT_327495 [Schizophyllum commune Tattone D]|nr:hypothetical protein K525DRAFT_245716 [Schizophyllum commune Loenen D]KAI5821893.1 hypothetical protein K523DRAFT_327495 [Schizophyllum commune Tattone D]